MRVASLIVVACLAAAPTATAVTSRTQVAVDVATSKWGVPCAGDVTYEWGPVESPYAAWASWSYLLPDPGPLGWTDCKITIDKTRAQRWRDQNFGFLCSLFVHEVGHLDGQSHSENPRSIMAPTIVKLWPRCEEERIRRGWR